jgi:hypothetical protein
MALNTERSKGRAQNFENTRGGTAADSGPFVGVVMNNVDPSRSGRLQVFIEQYSTGDASIAETWRWVSYLPPFYGTTQASSADSGSGTFPGNQQSYGMWFTPPDLGTRVFCFFVNGDPDQGYYVGCVPYPGLNRMIPGLGSVPAGQYITQNNTQTEYFANAAQLPVTEINSNNSGIDNNPRFFDLPKPVHSYQAAIFFQQGLINDIERGPIGSSAQRESPSSVYGISTPGQPIYQGGLDPNTIRSKIQSGEVSPQDVRVIGRQGGHTLVMDDGDLEGKNDLVRLRSAKGHQITMSDSGDFFYITHSNGQTWIELGAEGTVDVFSTNSVNIRTQGDINFHADRDVNMYAGRNFNVSSGQTTNIGSTAVLNLASEGTLTAYGAARVGIRSDAALNLKSLTGGWKSTGALTLSGLPILLNSGSAGDVKVPKLFSKTILDDTKFNYSKGWQVNPDGINSIVTRAPTHEPYPYHNQGTDAPSSVAVAGQPAPPPAAIPVPENWQIKVKT